MKKYLTLLALTLLSAGAVASPADLSFPPVSSAGHDFNHSPVGQSFTATAPDVRAGIYLADAASFENWLATIYPGQIIPGSYPYTIAPSVSVRIDLLTGEGTGGTLLYSETRTITAPFSGFVDVDAGAAGVALATGQQYTLMMTDISAQAYPQGVTGWVVPACSYSGGHPVLQGAVVTDDSGTGDNCFHVLDNVVSGSNAVITAYTTGIPGYIVINGGLNLLDHLWTDNLDASNTTFLDGLTNWYQTGLIVDYTGIATAQGVLLTSLTVKKAAPPPSTYTIPDESKGKITAVGSGYLMVGRKKLIWNASTLIIVNTPGGELNTITAFVKPGMRVQWKGLLDKATNTVLTSKLEIN